METTGHVKNGMVVPDNKGALPEGAGVRVAVLESDSESLGERLMRFSAIVRDLPEGFAENHDHYLHGRPKR